MKHYAPPIIATILLILCFYGLTNFLEKGLNKEKKEIELLVGKNIILQKDTLLITDYSIFSETYKLSNGTEISFKLAKELKQVP